jgi:hypothetical protein
VGQNHRQTGNEREDACQEHQRRVMEKCRNRFHHGMFLNGHRYRDQNAVQPDQPA